MALGIGEPTTSERCELSTGVAGLVAFAAAVIPHVLRLHRGKRTKRALVTVQHAADHGALMPYKSLRRACKIEIDPGHMLDHANWGGRVRKTPPRRHISRDK